MPTLRPRFMGLIALFSLVSAACSSVPAATSSSEAAPSEASSSVKAEHAKNSAEIRLQIATISAKSSTSKAESGVRMAREASEAALAELAAQAEADSIRVASAQLTLDRATGRASDAELELAELEAMYAEEEFAEKTKELVLSRGRRSLEHARRGLAIEQREMTQLVEVTLPVALKKLQSAVETSSKELESAERALVVAGLKARLDISEAEESLREAKEEEDDS